MPNEVKWYLENHIIILKSYDPYTPEDIKAGDEKIMNLLKESSAKKVHVIFDNSQVASLPNPRHFVNLQFTRHPATTWLVSIESQNRAVKFITTIAANLFRMRLRFFDTLQEGLKFLKENDPLLAELEIPDSNP